MKTDIEQTGNRDGALTFANLVATAESANQCPQVIGAVPLPRLSVLGAKLFSSDEKGRLAAYSKRFAELNGMDTANCYESRRRAERQLMAQAAAELATRDCDLPVLAAHLQNMEATQSLAKAARQVLGMDLRAFMAPVFERLASKAAAALQSEIEAAKDEAAKYNTRPAITDKMLALARLANWLHREAASTTPITGCPITFFRTELGADI